MAHSAEDITSYVLERDYNYRIPVHHSDVKHGFVISFQQLPGIDLEELEAKVKEIIAADVPISPAGEDRISIGTHQIPCTGTRTHVKHSGQIENFRLLKEFRSTLYPGAHAGGHCPHPRAGGLTRRSPGPRDLRGVWRLAPQISILSHALQTSSTNLTFGKVRECCRGELPWIFAGVDVTKSTKCTFGALRTCRRAGFWAISASGGFSGRDRSGNYAPNSDNILNG